MKLKNNSVLLDIFLLISENTRNPETTSWSFEWYGRSTTRDRRMEKLTKDLNAAMNTIQHSLYIQIKNYWCKIVSAIYWNKNVHAMSQSLESEYSMWWNKYHVTHNFSNWRKEAWKDSGFDQRTGSNLIEAWLFFQTSFPARFMALFEFEYCYITVWKATIPKDC